MTETDSISSIFEFLELIIVIFIVLAIFFYMNVAIQADSTIPTAAKDLMAKAATKAPTTFDYVALIAYIGIMLVSCIISLMRRSHPFIMPVMILIIILTTLFSVLARYYIIEGLFANATFTAIMINCPIIIYILNNIIMFSIIYAALVAICLMINPEQFGGGGSQW
jgi:hypothetical protein